METVYPDDKEIKFRKDNDGIDTVLNSTVKCAICLSDILSEIILKKMIMVHNNYLVLCCYNCFYKLFEGNEFSCILCRSNKHLSNCEKCNFNVCKRCIENHKIISVSNGVLKHCFNCVLHILWEQRSKAAHVLTIFSSQLDMPNGLLVNEIERDQTVRKYLVKESKIGQNQMTNNIKNQLCLDFMLNSFKFTVLNKLLEFSPKIDGTNSTEECLREFIQTCEQILEETCSTLTSFKRIFNLNSYLSPGVSAMMKSLLKSVDEDDSVLSSSRLNRNLNEEIKNNQGKQLLQNVNNKKTKNLNKEHLNDRLGESVASKLKDINVKPMDVNDSGSAKIVHNNSSNKDSSDIEIDEMNHPLELFDDSCSDEEKNSLTLRSRTVKINRKGTYKNKKKSIKNNTKLDDKSDDEKEIDRLIRMDNIHSSSKKNNMIESDTEDQAINVDNKLSEVQKSSKNNDMLELINEVIENNSETDYGTDNSEYEDHLLDTVKNIFSEIKSNGVHQIETITQSDDDTDDSCINEVVNLCLPACKEKNSKKSKENKFEMKTTSDMSDELDSDKNKESSSDESIVSYSKPNALSKLLLPLSSDSDSDFNGGKKVRGKKRKVASSDQSDSSSKFFKKSPKKQRKINVHKKSFFDVSSDSSDNSSDVITPKKRRQINQISSNESSYNTDESSINSDDSVANIPKKKGRKNIRKLKTNEELSEITKSALFEEESRIKRMEQRQKLYNQIYELPRQAVSCEKVVLDFDPKTKEELVVVHPDIVKFLKPHQVEGVKFMWNSVFESLARIKEHTGSGSILAHCMGLGKTLQVVALIHTLFRYPETGIKTVLIITPRAIIENWHNEFNKWLRDVSEEKKFFIYNLVELKTHESRKNVISEWKNNRGVLIISYQLYKTVINKSQKNITVFLEGLVDPGPDLVICDEGHIIKNQATAVAKTINRIKTLRRILLTGTPLQNNLKEYHCMVDFIRPNLLGSIKEFTNRFINPITNGQYSDSTVNDVKVMKRRSHVLHRMLEGFVQRCDYSVLTPFLPPKHEYVIYLKMADKQIELYRHYLDNHRQPELFTNYNILQMIWTHPKLLKLYSKRTETKREKEKLKIIESNFMQDESSDDNSANSAEDIEPVEVTDLTGAKSPDLDHNWWKPLVSKNDLESIHPYSKFLMMFSILKESEEIGDKVILFSQSLFTLNLIQNMLDNAEDFSEDNGGFYGKSWVEGEDYFRIDGSVSGKIREDCCHKFNDLKNTKLRLLLLSTKAFNLGINLVGANRVIIFDVTWNPSLNVQSIFRIFRFGQSKPCYIYRLISEGTMEQKIYERQISKLSMAFRVVDEHQIDRHFNAKDQEELYEFEPNTTEPKSTLNLPKDRLMAELILKHKDLVMDILEHDSLLQNNEAEELDESDRNAAWEDYQKEKAGLSRATESVVNQFTRESMVNNPIYNQLNSFANMLPPTLPGDFALFSALKNLFPQASMEHVNEMMKHVKAKKMKNNVEQ
ncbi:Hypothetical protein CINCED_3A017329 [Cinara cedri]|uniref:Transcriptional regulator ATRX n=1 Tax=Cinara cedri TaxID=506608 RepID=A0A5E4MEJ2_9HEMI|nr:Hypothetical protein CINCED_3A017329 [Cinara cedri]